MTKDDEKLCFCRVCINEIDDQDTSYNIFENFEDFLTSGTPRDILIADKLTACADVKIKNDDGLPNRICSSCVLELEDAYNFRRKCEKSDDILRIASRTIPDNKYQVHVKDEIVSDDNATPTQSDDMKPTCGSPSVDQDFKPDEEEQTDVVIPELAVQTANNKSIDIKRKNLKFECHDCGHIFKSKCKLSVHCRKEHSKLPIACQFCKLQFKSFQAYFNHQKNRPKTCISLSDFRIEGVGNSRHFYCKECKYNTKTVNNSIQHLVVHTKQSNYKCDLCDRSFVRTVTLKGHKERTHKYYYGEKACHICGLVFKGFTSYDSHMRTHRKKNKAQCDICFKMCASKSSLNTHKKTHSDLRSYVCQKCPAKFRTSAGLNCHKTVHNEEMVACKVCGYKLKNRYSIKKHESEHDHSNVACRVCGKFFHSDANLELHMKRHDRRHPCDYCDKTYNARKILTEHLRKVHKVYVSSSELKGVNIRKNINIQTGTVTGKHLEQKVA